MGLVTRVLSPEEWPRIAHTDLSAFLPLARPEDVRIVVVEDGAQIVACWGVLRMTHLEGAWIDPAYRKRSSVARRLWATTFAIARQFGSWAITGAQTDDVRHLLTAHLNAQRIEMPDTYVVPVETSCR